MNHFDVWNEMKTKGNLTSKQCNTDTCINNSSRPKWKFLFGWWLYILYYTVVWAAGNKIVEWETCCASHQEVAPEFLTLCRARRVALMLIVDFSLQMNNRWTTDITRQQFYVRILFLCRFKKKGVGGGVITVKVLWRMENFCSGVRTSSFFYIFRVRGEWRNR